MTTTSIMLQHAADDLKVSRERLQIHERYLSDELWRISSYRSLIEDTQQLSRLLDQVIQYSARLESVMEGSCRVKDLRRVWVEGGGYQSLRRFQQGHWVTTWNDCASDVMFVMARSQRRDDGRFYWQGEAWRNGW
jgi:hypothetical protein